MFSIVGTKTHVAALIMAEFCCGGFVVEARRIASVTRMRDEKVQTVLATRAESPYLVCCCAAAAPVDLSR